jgi:hypothetical protein
LSGFEIDGTDFQTFYEKLGFKRTGGDGTGYVMKTNGDAVIGLFQGMFKGTSISAPRDRDTISWRASACGGRSQSMGR